MSGIKNIKKKLKGFQVRPPNAEVIKKVLLHIPYMVVFYVVNKCTWLYQYCRGSTVVDRLMVLLMNYPLAFKKLLPSIQPKSLAAGTIAAVSVWAVVYFKGKNGKKFRQGEEYGSARWGNEKDIAPFIDPVFENNILLTQTERLTMNSRPKKPKYARNKNVIVIGGSGSGKTRFYVKPQLMQMPDNVSFVVTDPKGTIIVECGKMLARGTPKKDKNGKILRDKNGRVVMAPYKIKVLNTINFAKSMHYNPFHYIRSEKDILKLVNTIMVNTKGEGEKSSEDFWTKAERLLYCALIGYIYYEAPEEEQNFSTLLEFINASETREEDEEFKNAVDLLFEELERDEPNHFAVRQYKKYKLAAGKTAKSILISCGARLAPFDIAELRELMSYDEMELDMIGDQRTALFIVISDTDDTFNFVVAMMYSQLFNLLCDRADDVHHGRLPYHVRILCDEFANIGQIPKFDKLIATIRSREISASIILQSQSQLKTIYKDAAETITGNCVRPEVASAIPKEEIAFIHEYNTEVRKAELFAKVRAGQVRILMGSTPKLGAGTNVQDKLLALHHLDCPWKPSDLEQQEGRILRQGNQNDKVKIFRYVTENTFDSYMWQILENKQKFISQIMTSKSPVRACEDVDDTALSYAEIKALATGNEYIKEKMDLDVQVSKLKLLKANHTSQIYRLESDIAKRYPVQIAALKEKIAGMRVDAEVVKGIDLQDNDHFAMTVGGKLYTDKKEAGVALISAASGLRSVKSAGQIGEYHGFALSSEYNFLSNTYTMTIKGKCSYKIEFGKDTLGNIQRIHNALSAIEKKLADTEQNLETVQQQLKTAQEEVQKPFPKEAELSEKMERLAELNAMLNMDEKGGENLLADEGIGENPEVNVPEEQQDRIADSVHKTSVLERLKEQKQQAGETHQKPKKKHEQEL